MILKINKHIEIIRSTDTRLSSMSDKSCQAIYKTLKKYYQTVGISTVNNIIDLDKLVDSKPDLVFTGMKYVPTANDNKVWVADYLEEFGILHTGSSGAAMANEFSKNIGKDCMISKGIPTSKYLLIGKNAYISAVKIDLKYPIFIKPVNLGGGLGIDNQSIAKNFTELKNKVSQISSKFNVDSLLEEYLPGREFSVALMFDTDSQSLQAMPLEIIAPKTSSGENILTQAIKLADTEETILVEEEVLRAKLVRLAIDAFYAIGARDYGRIDMKLDKLGEPHFLEANLIPSLIKNYGNFPKACRLNENINYEQMILSIAELGFSHQQSSLVSELDAINIFDSQLNISLPV